MVKYYNLINKLLKNRNQYIWYACYGSNINYDRFMLYINGGKYATKKGCSDKSRPLEFKKYIFKHPIYFAGESKNWTGGMAFLDYKKIGKCYGKIYKIKLSQFIEIYEQENKLYNHVLLLDYIDDIPVLTFTSRIRLNNLLNNPSSRYIQIIVKGLKDLNYNLTKNQIDNYFRNKEEI